MTLLFFAGCAEEKADSFSLSNDTFSVSAKTENTDAFTGEETVSAGGDASGEGTAPYEATVLVHICGEVQSPGVYELDAEARICDVLLMAGGFTQNADTEAVNMAAGIEDGMQIVIPACREDSPDASRMADAASGTEHASGNTASGSEHASGNTASGSGYVSGGSRLVNINTADKEQLTSLPGIGAGKAQAIIAYREAGGVFRTIEDIMQVDGIKAGVYDKIKDRICVQ